MRTASAVITFWVGIAALLVVIGAPLLAADWRVFRFSLGPSLLLAWILWIALYRPAVHYDDARAVVVNIGRRHVLPWGHVTDVRQGIGLFFDLDAGKPVVAFGVPARRPPGNIASAIDRRTRPTHDLNREADLLDGVRRAAAPSPEPVVTRWEVVPLVIGAVLVVGVVLEFALGI
ncbi:hypothetical protein BH10ACT6_BH10ACT6_09960 [soil metagenome]